MEPLRFPSDTNRVDEFVIEVRNPTDSARSLPLIFDEIKAQAITGTSMLLCEEDDGRPKGIPVQISKNWHRSPIVKSCMKVPGFEGMPWSRLRLEKRGGFAFG
jgi:hypothetical protein